MFCRRLKMNQTLPNCLRYSTNDAQLTMIHKVMLGIIIGHQLLPYFQKKSQEIILRVT